MAPDSSANLTTRKKIEHMKLVKGIAVGAGVIAAGGAGLALWARRSPLPSALLIRYFFDRGGRDRQKVLKHFVPESGYSAYNAVSYDASEPKATMDIAVPQILDDSQTTSEHLPDRFPLVVWVHGGAWLAGVKEDNSDYLRLLATEGFVTASVDYPLAPEAQYPRSINSVLAAVRFLLENSATYHIDPTRVFFAGDSAGAQLAMQAALVVRSQAYADKSGLKSPMRADHLKGQVLYCGAYDFTGEGVSPTLEKFFRTVMWAYSGVKDFESEDAFVFGNVISHVDSSLPPTLVNAGNKDFLVEQSKSLVSALEQAGVPVEAIFYENDHNPGLEHEFQFDLRLEEAQEVYDRAVEFLHANCEI